MILRDLIALEDQGGDEFFGEPEFDTAELLRTRAGRARGHQRGLELPRCRTSPQLFRRSSCGCWPTCYHDLPEVGDVDKPKLVFFFDEAHLLFNDASKAFLDADRRRRSG